MTRKLNQARKQPEMMYRKERLPVVLCLLLAFTQACAPPALKEAEETGAPRPSLERDKKEPKLLSFISVKELHPWHPPEGFLSRDEISAWLLRNVLAKTKSSIVKIIRPDGRHGTGFIISEDGYILTSAAILESEKLLEKSFVGIVLNNGIRHLGAIHVVDEKHGFSLVKIIPKKRLSPITLGDSSKVKPGEFCIAAGWNPIPTRIPNVGIINATDQTYQSWIQTGPIVNDQNGGGPLLDIFGNAIGINAALWAGARGTPLLGFVEPINKIKNRIAAEVQIVKDKPTIIPPPKLLKTQEALVSIILKMKDYTVNISSVREGKPRFLGSGVIVSNEGYIITNNHIVEDAKGGRLEVKTHDAREFIGRVLKQYPRIDLALISVDGSFNLEPIPIGDYKELKEGELLLSMGNPFGLEHTANYGVAKSIGHVTHVYYDVIKTDVPIHPGNSGGPLINIKGELIGINMARWLKSGVSLISPRAGYAVSITREAITKMIKGEDLEFRDTWLGVTIQKVTPEIAKSLGLDENVGALIARLSKGGPAERAGINNGDVILEVGGKKIRSSKELPPIIASLNPGTKVPMLIFRGGNKKTIIVTIGLLPEK